MHAGRLVGVTPDAASRPPKGVSNARPADDLEEAARLGGLRRGSRARPDRARRNATQRAATSASGGAYASRSMAPICGRRSTPHTSPPTATRCRKTRSRSSTSASRCCAGSPNPISSAPSAPARRLRGADRRRPVWFGDWLEARILHRYALEPGDLVSGPAVIEEPDSAVVVQPGWQAEAGPQRIRRLTRS